MPGNVRKIQSHYVPQGFLKGFIHEELHVYNKERKRFRSSSPKGVAYEVDFYIVDTVDQKDSIEVEEGLSKIENVVIPLLRKLRSNDPLSSSEWADIAIYIAIQYGRTPTARKRMDDVYTIIVTNEVKFHLAETLNAPDGYMNLSVEFESEHPDIKFPSREALGEMILKPGPIGEMHADNGTFVKMFFEMSEEIAAGLLSRRWQLLQAPRGSSFITSDNPVALLNRGPLPPNRNLAILVEGVEIYMPIDSTNCLAIDSRPNNGEFMKHKVNKRNVRAINHLVFSQAGKFVISGNKALLKSLVES
jgi:hypothetical protein